MTANNTSRLPYDSCLIPNLSVEVQHQVLDFTNYVLRPFGVLLAVISLVCNSLVVFAVTRTKPLQKPSMMMLCSLSISDVLYSPYSLYKSIRELSHEYMCFSGFSKELISVGILCKLATLGSLAIVSRDRFLAVRKPFIYRHHMTKSRAIKMICVIWLISLILSFLVYLSGKMGGGTYLTLSNVASSLNYLMCFVVIIVCHVGVFCKRHSPAQLHHIQAILDREKRLANTVGLIFLVLLLTFLPALLCPLVLAVTGVGHIYAFTPFMEVLFHLNGFLHPILNFGRSKEMRNAVGNFCRQQVQPSSVVDILQINNNNSSTNNNNNNNNNN